MHEANDLPLTGHQGYTKTYRAIKERFSWKGLKENVLHHVKECEVCQHNKGEMNHPTSLLQPLPIPEGKWESISMDFITGFPMVQGKDCISVVVDRLTKYTHCFAISTHYTAAQVVELFFEISSGYMVFPIPLSVTGTVASWEDFGRRFFDWWGPS